MLFIPSIAGLCPEFESTKTATHVTHNEILVQGISAFREIHLICRQDFHLILEAYHSKQWSWVLNSRVLWQLHIS